MATTIGFLERSIDWVDILLTLPSNKILHSLKLSLDASTFDGFVLISIQSFSPKYAY